MTTNQPSTWRPVSNSTGKTEWNTPSQWPFSIWLSSSSYIWLTSLIETQTQNAGRQLLYLSCLRSVLIYIYIYMHGYTGCTTPHHPLPHSITIPTYFICIMYIVDLLAARSVLELYIYTHTLTYTQHTHTTHTHTDCRVGWPRISFMCRTMRLSRIIIIDLQCPKCVCLMIEVCCCCAVLCLTAKHSAIVVCMYIYVCMCVNLSVCVFAIVFGNIICSYLRFRVNCVNICARKWIGDG